VEFRQDIQGLRAVAVLLVIADHSGVRWLTGGFVGVDVFFVVSGYLITLLLLKEAASTGRIRIGEFYARRARRILPAASLVIVVTMVYAAHEASLSRVRELRADGVWSAFFAANIHFSRLQTDYFAQGPEPSPFQHYWSLAVEEQFYLVWPLLLAVVLLAVARAASRDAMRTRVVTACWS
jgi:peptidoglycan/LPS O-acetylase OafA/YrhL